MPVMPASQSGDDVQVQRLAQGAGLLGAVQDGDLLAVSGRTFSRALEDERTVQTDLDQADLLAVGVQVVDDFLEHVADGAHGHDDAVGIGCAVVVEQIVVGAQLLVDLRHVLLDHGGQRVVNAVAGLTVLEEDVAVLVAAAHLRVLGVQSAGRGTPHGLHVAHFLQIGVVPLLDLLDLVGGTEAVEEVQERNVALDGGQVGNRRQVHDLLHVALGQHGEAGLAAAMTSV